MLHCDVSIVALTKLNTGSTEGLSRISLKVKYGFSKLVLVHFNLLEGVSLNDVLNSCKWSGCKIKCTCHIVEE